jgi:hypothetical protein
MEQQYESRKNMEQNESQSLPENDDENQQLNVDENYTYWHQNPLNQNKSGDSTRAFEDMKNLCEIFVNNANNFAQAKFEINCMFHKINTLQNMIKYLQNVNNSLTTNMKHLERDKMYAWYENRNKATLMIEQNQNLQKVLSRNKELEKETLMARSRINELEIELQKLKSEKRNYPVYLKRN